MGYFRSSVWDPVLIIAQIVSMQCIFYVGFGCWIVLVNYIGGLPLAIDQIFNYQVTSCKFILLFISFYSDSLELLLKKKLSSLITDGHSNL